MENCGKKIETILYIAGYDPESEMNYFKDEDAFNDSDKICYIPASEYEDEEVTTFTENDVKMNGIGYSREDLKEILEAHIEDNAPSLAKKRTYVGFNKAMFLEMETKRIFAILNGYSPEVKINDMDEEELLEDFEETIGKIIV